MLAWVRDAFRIDSAYFIHSSFWALLQNSVGFLLGTLLQVALARLLTRSQLGEYDLIASLMGLFTLAAVPGINQLVVQASARGQDGVLQQGFKISIFGLSLSIPILLSVSSFYAIHGEYTVGLGLVVLGLTSVIRLPSHLYEPFLQGKKRFDLTALFSFLSSLAVTSGIIVSAFIAKSVLILISVQGVIQAALDAGFFAITRSFMRSKGRDKELFSYGLFLTITSIVPIISGAIDKVLLAALFTTSELGLYFVATTIPAALQRFAQALTDVTFPKIATLSREDQELTVKRHSLTLFIMTVFLCGALLFLLPWVIPLIFTKAFLDATLYAQLELVSFVLFPLNVFLANFLTVQRRRSSQILISVVPSGAKIILSFICIPFFGIFAIIGVNFLTRILVLGMTLYAIFKRND